MTAKLDEEEAGGDVLVSYVFKSYKMLFGEKYRDARFKHPKPLAQRQLRSKNEPHFPEPTIEYPYPAYCEVNSAEFEMVCGKQSIASHHSVAIDRLNTLMESMSAGEKDEVSYC